MPLISFEKYLREVEDVHLIGKQGRAVALRVGGPTGPAWAEWTDDPLYSITGRVVESLKRLYPDGDGLSSSPLVQVVHGANVDSMLGGIDFAKLRSYIENTHAEHPTSITDTIDNYLSSVENGGELSRIKYAFADACHQLAVAERQEGPFICEVEEELPPASAADFMEVIMGVKQMSLCPAPGGRLPTALRDAFLELHPTAVERDGGLYIRGVVTISLRDCLGLEGDVPALGPRPEVRAVPAGAVARALPQDPRRGAAAAAPAGGFGPAEGVDGVEVGIEHVEHYAAVDPNNLDPAEKEIYQYGFDGARQWIERLSPGARRRLFRDVSVGEHEAVVVIGTLSRALARELGPTSRRVLTDDQFALMAGSRVLSQIGNWTLHDTGIWIRRR